MYYNTSKATDIKRVEIKDGQLNIWYEDGFYQNIDKEDIEKNPAKYITIAEYINATIQEVEPLGNENASITRN